MIAGLVSVVVPSRNEIFLVKTVQDLLAKATGPTEIIAVLDGYWEVNLPADPRVRILHRGTAQGMRQGINAAVAMSTGEYLMKADAHTLWSESYDEVLKRDLHEDNWILVPRRYPLDPDKWAIQERTDGKYPIDYHALSEPFGKYGDSVPGLHANPWRAKRDERKDVMIDRTIGAQGSAWFMSRKHWDRIGPMDQSRFGAFWYEDLELSMKTWLTGGAEMVSKNVSYCHWFKGQRGRGYSTRGMGHEEATAYTKWFFMTDQPFPGKVRTFRSVIESFMPMPTWIDIDGIFDRARREFRNPYEVAA